METMGQVEYAFLNGLTFIGNSNTGDLSVFKDGAFKENYTILENGSIVKEYDHSISLDDGIIFSKEQIKIAYEDKFQMLVLDDLKDLLVILNERKSTELREWIEKFFNAEYEHKNEFYGLVDELLYYLNVLALNEDDIELTRWSNPIDNDKLIDVYSDLAEVLTEIDCERNKVSVWVETEPNEFSYTEEAQEIYNNYDQVAEVWVNAIYYEQYP